ncbi:hypothetical protein ACFV4P_15380 [Kitasatospora sp. NPDC059795]|uniref:hypothetical protein n=1 Tax=Kitasatospora sp. NPDC059795 TaxID=3346949 RepID=UPI00364ABE3C
MTGHQPTEARTLQELLPANPYEPSAFGELVTDGRTGQTGAYMGTWTGLVHLRPLRGGEEWRVPLEWITEDPTELEAKLRERNRDSHLTDAHLPRDAS